MEEISMSDNQLFFILTKLKEIIMNLVYNLFNPLTKKVEMIELKIPQLEKNQSQPINETELIEKICKGLQKKKVEDIKADKGLIKSQIHNLQEKNNTISVEIDNLKKNNTELKNLLKKQTDDFETLLGFFYELLKKINDKELLEETEREFPEIN